MAVKKLRDDPGEIHVAALTVQCFKCRAANAVLEDVSVPRDRTEQFDVIEPMLNAQGWALVGPKGNRQIYCPVCAADTINNTIKLPVYNPKGGCPKCGHRQLDTFYSSGLETITLVQQEHLVRACKRCRYKWAEAPLDITNAVGAVTDPVTPSGDRTVPHRESRTIATKES